jgi:hypothetical protein
MPSARANISAKFIAQIEISKPCVRRASRPAEASKPRIVSISGSPAATSEPKASTRIAMVTGQEKSSLFIIALRFASLKSDHIPDAPVRLTETSPVPSARSFDFRSSAAATIAVGSCAAPAITIAVWRSAEIVEPGRGGITDATRRSVRSTRSTRRAVDSKAGEPAVALSEWRTTIRAELDWPPKSRWTSCRTRTDSEPFACQPAPDSTLSTLGANTASTAAASAHARATASAWRAAHSPRRPIGPTPSALVAGGDGAVVRASRTVI